MRIIGICGKKRHGKNTVARSIAELRPKSHTIAFADPIKRICMELWGLSYEQVYGDDLKEVVDPRWNLSPREFMQRLGAEVGRNIHSETWTRHCIQNIKDAHNGYMPWIHDEYAKKFLPARTDIDLWCVSDVRYENEVQAIRQEGGVILKVERPGILNTDMHSSETGIDAIVADHTIINTSKDGIHADVASFLREFKL